MDRKTAVFARELHAEQLAQLLDVEPDAWRDAELVGGTTAPARVWKRSLEEHAGLHVQVQTLDVEKTEGRRNTPLWRAHALLDDAARDRVDSLLLRVLLADALTREADHTRRALLVAQYRLAEQTGQVQRITDDELAKQRRAVNAARKRQRRIVHDTLSRSGRKGADETNKEKAELRNAVRTIGENVVLPKLWLEQKPGRPVSARQLSIAMAADEQIKRGYRTAYLPPGKLS